MEYLQLVRNLEKRYDQMCHPKKRPDIFAALEASTGRMLELKSKVTRLHTNTVFLPITDSLKLSILSPMRLSSLCHAVFAMIAPLWSRTGRLSSTASSPNTASPTHRDPRLPLHLVSWTMILKRRMSSAEPASGAPAVATRLHRLKESALTWAI
jgi:hypothetical protein